MLGESAGLETLYPPEGQPVQFQAHVSARWESCERFFTLDFYADIPNLGPETFHAMITYSEDSNCYRMWSFEASHEEPMYMEGNFQGDQLVLVSDPTKMIWGFQRLRYTFTPHRDGSVEVLGERWEPDGYAKHCSVVFRPTDPV
jgi:hypothetical protein